MKPKSHTLFHFTRTPDTLKMILKDGFWPRFCLEDLRWYNAEMQFSAFPIVCFCDIPLSRIDEHVDFYGEFGIGLTKDWAKKNGLNPVLYVSETSNVASHLRDLSWANTHYPEEQQKDVFEKFLGILAHIKPVEGKMTIGEEVVPKEFYQENEWRFLACAPEYATWLNRESYNNEAIRESQNELTKENSSLAISPHDVKYIFVKSDSNIPDMVNFIQTELDNFTGIEQKILVSRVISIESIRNDL